MRGVRVVPDSGECLRPERERSTPAAPHKTKAGPTEVGPARLLRAAVNRSAVLGLVDDA
jgi:hypothetical protein